MNHNRLAPWCVARAAMRLAWLLACLFALLPLEPAAAVPLSKILCDTPPASWTLNTPCGPQSSGASPGVQGTGPYTAAYYKIDLDNTGGGATSAALTDTFPAGFHATSVVCTATNGSNAGAVVFTAAGSAVLNASSIAMLANQKVTCVVAGYFDGSGQSWSNQAASGSNQSNQLNSTIPQTSLQTDISIVKTCTPTAVTVTGSSQTVHCHVVITNNGPKDAFLGGILHFTDELALTANGVPLSIGLAGAPTCVASPTIANGIAVDCLNGTPSATTPPLNASFTPFFGWSYAAGTQGYLPVNGTMTIDYTLVIARNPNINCIKDLNPAGFINRAKIEFTLPSGVAVIDTNPANNISSPTTITVATGIQTVDPLCGTAVGWAPFTIDKQLQSTQPAAWGSNVVYQIKITNLTSQTLNNVMLSDWSENLPGTPPFSANTVSWLPPIPGSANLGPKTIPGYYSIDQIWRGPLTGITLAPNATLTIIAFRARYTRLRCDSYHNGTDPIRNVFRAQWTGTATPPGGGGPVTQTWFAEGFADVQMALAPPCQLGATKVAATTPNKIIFGQWFQYNVSFKNLDPSNQLVIGTLADRLRIVPPNYATAMQLDYTFNCPAVGGILNQPLNGGASGVTLTYAQQPHQGINLLTRPNPNSPVVFPANATLSCVIRVRLQRPPKGDPFCMGAGQPQIENVVFMDVSQSYGASVPWPPSGTYIPTLPTPQPVAMGSQNWASVRTDLPHCFNLQVNKAVSPAVTWVTNTTPTEYTITVHNFGDTIPLAPFNTPGTQWPNWVGPQLQDYFTQNPPTSAVTSSTSPANCFANFAAQCVRLGPPTPPLPPPPLPGLGPFPPPFHIGIEGIAHNQNVIVKFTVNPVCQYPKAKNEVILFWSGPNATTDWYANDDRTCFGPPPLIPPYSLIPPNTVVGSCSRVEQPCLRVGDLQVVKTVINPLGIATPANFGMTVNCTPYGFPPPNTPITVAAGGSTTVANIPETSNCTVTEPAPASIPNVAVCGGGTATWSTAISPNQPVTIVANQTVTVTVTNTLVCNVPTAIGKGYEHPGSATFPPGAHFDFTAVCTLPGNSSAPPITQTVQITSGSANFASVPLPLGWLCTATEAGPTGVDANGCFWSPGIAVSPNPVTIQLPPPNNFVAFRNNFICPAINKNYDIGVAKVPLGDVGSDKAFVITIQNIGNNSLSAADLSHITVTDNLPAGSIVTGYGNTSTADWSCPATPTPAPVTCQYSGSLASLASFAALPQLQIVATPGPGPTTQYVNPQTGQVVTINMKLNCVVIALTGTNPNHDDMNLLNNSLCISM